MRVPGTQAMSVMRAMSRQSAGDTTGEGTPPGTQAMTDFASNETSAGTQAIADYASNASSLCCGEQETPLVISRSSDQATKLR